ncbi:dehydrogenase/reductase (SDR family) X chromosome (predicted), isoform CRA_c [Rattus norvegicus]|uniref:Dehydrogenase/reductase (SDR family) X chromosome (Predicted), isoform CRA_c n=1 Tax=Rattus norvegicus TaxID=10116 RepID=A6K201_RAT|nr:dehydrogenase/reductase (SDR family) X chromosome (predicted), isoform CRA_c [Rattus norvegicus]
MVQLLRRLRGGFRPPELPLQADRVAIVTGATRGVGLSTACQLARLGMRVIVAGNDEHRGHEVVARIQEESGPESALCATLRPQHCHCTCSSTTVRAGPGVGAQC